MGRKTGATTMTAKRVVVDAGALYVDYGTENERVLGATAGGATFTLEQEVREMEVDGFRGPIKGGRRVIEEHARISASLLELTSENLKLAIFGATATDYIPEGGGDATHVQVQRMTDVAEDSEYKNVALVGRVQGSNEPIVIGLENALSDGELELETEDEEEGSVEVRFTAHFDPCDPDVSPWWVRYPKDVNEDVPCDNGEENND